METTTLDKILHDAQLSQNGNLNYDHEQITKDVALTAASIYEGLGIRILSIFGGFLACGFFLGFLFIAGIIKSNASMLTTGIIFLAGTIAMNLMTEKRFFDGAAIALYLSGILLIAAGSEFRTGTTSITLLTIAVLMLAIIKNQLLIFLSVLLFFGSLLGLAYNTHQSAFVIIITTLLTASYTLASIAESWLITADKRINIKYTSLRAGSLFSFAGMLIMTIHTNEYLLFAGRHWLTWCVIMIAIITTLHRIIINAHSAFTSHPAVTQLPTTNPTPITTGSHQPLKTLILLAAAATILMLPMLFTPAIPGALLILLVSVHTRSRTGFALGMISFIYFISRYYYNLNQTLLIKSILLFSMGILFTASWLLIKKYWLNEKV